MSKILILYALCCFTDNFNSTKFINRDEICLFDCYIIRTECYQLEDYVLSMYLILYHVVILLNVS